MQMRFYTLTTHPLEQLFSFAHPQLCYTSHLSIGLMGWFVLQVC